MMALLFLGAVAQAPALIAEREAAHAVGQVVVFVAMPLVLIAVVAFMILFINPRSL